MQHMPNILCLYCRRGFGVIVTVVWVTWRGTWCCCSRTLRPSTWRVLWSDIFSAACTYKHMNLSAAFNSNYLIKKFVVFLKSKLCGFYYILWISICNKTHYFHHVSYYYWMITGSHAHKIGITRSYKTDSRNQ